MSVSTVSATGIQDPTGQVFANGTWRLEFVPTYGTPGIYNDGGLPFTKQYGGSLDATGSFSQAGVNRNDTIAPAGSQWRFTAIPAVNGTTYSVLLNVNTPAFDVTAAINAVITNIVVSPTNIARAYKDVELVNVDGSGAIYYDETLKVLKVWDAVGSLWQPSGLPGSTVIVIPSGDMGAQINAAAAKIGLTNAGTIVVADGGGTATTLITIGKLHNLIFGKSSTANPYTVVGIRFTDSTTDTTCRGAVIRGQGRESTFIQLAAGANTDVISQTNFGALTGTLSSFGLFRPTVRDLTIDGNASTQASGNGIRLYGSGLQIFFVDVQNCKQKGVYTEWGNDLGLGVDFDMSGMFLYVRSTSNGGDGWTHNGPHDSMWVGLNTLENGGVGWQDGSAASGQVGSGAGSHIWNFNSYLNAINQVVINIGGVTADNIATGGPGNGITINSLAGPCTFTNGTFASGGVNGIGVDVKNQLNYIQGTFINNSGVGGAGLKLEGVENHVKGVWSNNTTAVIFAAGDGANYVEGPVDTQAAQVVKTGTPAISDMLNVTGNHTDLTSLVQFPRAATFINGIVIPKTDGTVPGTLVGDGIGGFLFTTNAGKTFQIQNGGGLVMSANAAFSLVEGGGVAGFAGFDILYADSTAHRFKMFNNNGAVQTVAALEGDTFTTPIIKSGMQFNGATSGATNLTPQPIAGSTSLLLPAATGTLLATGNGATPVQTKRVTTGSVGAGVRVDVTITWTTAFADANYTPVATMLDTSAAGTGLVVERIRSVTAGSIVVQVINNSGGALTGTVQAMAIHD